MPVPRGEPASSAVAYDSLTKPEIIANLRQNLPRDIRATPAFVMFKFAPAREPGGKRMKLPYYVVNRKVRSGAQGSEEDISHLVRFRKALELLEADTTGKWDGIGVCALRTNGFFAIDIDHCLDSKTGKPNALAKELLGWNTYAEYSPSGRGLRLLMLGNPQVNYKNNAVGLELFCNKGFVTLTGNHYGRLRNQLSEVTAAQAARLKVLVHADGNGSESSNGSGDSADSGLDDINNIPSPLDDERYEDALQAIQYLNADCDYDKWIKIGQCLHSGDQSERGRGFKLWLRWSKRGIKFEHTSRSEMLRKWRGFRAGRGNTIKTFFRYAIEEGYVKKLVKDKKADRAAKVEIKVADFEIGCYSAASVPKVEESPLAIGLFGNYGAYLFIGRAKIGKSRILAPLCCAALTGTKALGWFPFVKRCNVLALTLEEDAHSLLERMRIYSVEPLDYSSETFQIVDDEVLAAAALKYADDLDWVEFLDLLLQKHKPDFVFIDTLIKLRLLWPTAPEYKSKTVTGQDYESAAWVEQVARKNKCVILGLIHGSKRKNMPALNNNFDPFESVGTTSWILAGCVGAIVLMDKPGTNALEDKDDGQRVLSIRGRYNKPSDTHWMLQSNPATGVFTNLGEYHMVKASLRQHEFLHILSDFMAEGFDWVTAKQIGATAGCREHTVKVHIKEFADTQQLYEERRLESKTGRGYRLIAVGKAPKKFSIVENADDILA